MRRCTKTSKVPLTSKVLAAIAVSPKSRVDIKEMFGKDLSLTFNYLKRNKYITFSHKVKGIRGQERIKYKITQKGLRQLLKTLQLEEEITNG